MKEIYGDLWKLADTGKYDLVCITTNGFVKSGGEAVMGRGCALEATKKFKNIKKNLGKLLKTNGNKVQIVDETSEYYLVSFPVKHNWWEEADIELIESSCYQLMKMIADKNTKVLLPRPGCGNGKLAWENVKEVIESILDDRIYIVHFKRSNNEY